MEGPHPAAQKTARILHACRFRLCDLSEAQRDASTPARPGVILSASTSNASTYASHDPRDYAPYDPAYVPHETSRVPSIVVHLPGFTKEPSALRNLSAHPWRCMRTPTPVLYPSSYLPRLLTSRELCYVPLIPIFTLIIITRSIIDEHFSRSMSSCSCLLFHT